MGIAGRPPDLVSQRTGASHVEQRTVADAAGTLTHMEMPDELSALGQQIWQVVIPPLLEAKILRPEDALLLVEVCEAWGLVYYFRRALWIEIEGSNDGNEVKRLRTGWLQSLAAARGMLNELGIGPVARVRTRLIQAGATGGLLGQLPSAGDHDD